MGKKAMYGFLALAASVLVLVGCSNNNQQSAEEIDCKASSENCIQGTNRHVIEMPNGYRNVVVVCDGPNGVYVTSRGAFKNSASSDIKTLPSSIAVVANDPNCKK